MAPGGLGPANVVDDERGTEPGVPLRLAARIWRENEAPARARAAGGWVATVVDSAIPAGKPRRVLVSPVACCGRCDRCRGGLSQHCRVATESAMGADGRALVAPGRLATILDTLKDDVAACAAPVASVLHAMRSVRRSGQGFVTVIGDRPESMLITRLLADRIPAVRLLTDGAWSQRIADQWGIKHRPRREAGRREDQETVIVDADDPDAFLMAAGLARPRGTVVVTAAAVPSAGRTLAEILQRELTVIGVGPADVTGLSEALSLLARGTVDVSPLITRRMSAAAFASDGAVSAAGRDREGWTLLLQA